jgi:uracil-DNA glycosylase family 4
VDAKDRLRRYLEQRRELGESEFVLDGLSVEEVLKLVGLRPGGASPRQRSGVSRAPEPVPGIPGAPPPGPPPGMPEGPPPGMHDAPPVSAFDSPAARPAPMPPPVPERRFDETVSTDWRATLRNAGALRPGAGASTGASDSDGKPVPPSSPSAPPPQTPASSSGAYVLPSWLAALDLSAGLEAGRLQLGDLAPDVSALPTLEAISARVAGCTACALHKTARNPVPGEGHPHADFLCVGEAPGAQEDELGRPFVGESGQLLTKILGAIQLSREDVYICNVLKHRPPGNRDPLPEEVQVCQPFLLRQIELVQPKVILALGRFAAQTLLQTTTAIGALRGKVHGFHGVPLIVTYHPAALLRNEAWKRPAWEDVKLARRILDAARTADRGAE